MSLRILFHPHRALLELAESRLPAAERLRLERHLARCAACRSRLDRMRATIARLEAWPVDGPAPPFDHRRLAATNDAAWRRRRFETAGAAALALVVALGLLLAFRVATSERIELLHANAAPSEFESLALAEHAALRTASAPVTLASDSAAEIRRWLRDQGGYSAALVAERPASEHRFELLGARPAVRDALRAAAIATRIDGLPVTLVVGHAAEVDGLPAWSPFGKQLQVRRDPASGSHLLSWKNAGKAYTLVTDPAVAPRLACQLCHTDPRRLATIERVAGQL